VAEEVSRRRGAPVGRHGGLHDAASGRGVGNRAHDDIRPRRRDDQLVHQDHRDASRGESLRRRVIVNLVGNVRHESLLRAQVLDQRPHRSGRGVPAGNQERFGGQVSQPDRRGAGEPVPSWQDDAEVVAQQEMPFEAAQGGQRDRRQVVDHGSVGAAAGEQLERLPRLVLEHLDAQVRVGTPQPPQCAGDEGGEGTRERGEPQSPRHTRAQVGQR